MVIFRSHLEERTALLRLYLEHSLWYILNYEYFAVSVTNIRKNLCVEMNFDSLTIMTLVSDSYLPKNPLIFQCTISIASGIALNVEYLYSLHHYSPFNVSDCCITWTGGGEINLTLYLQITPSTRNKNNRTAYNNSYYSKPCDEHMCVKNNYSYS